MKYLYNSLLLCFIIFISLAAKSQNDIIPKGLINPSFGVNGGNVDISRTAVTKDNYTYVAGNFNNTADFDLTEDTFNISSTYGYNIFVAKYDKQSHLVFAFKLSGLSGSDVIDVITTDKDDNVYITGAFGGTLDFDPGAGVANLSTGDYSYFDNFIAKYDRNGKFVFAKQLKSNNHSGYIASIQIDKNSNIFIAGHGNTSQIDFDPGVGIAHPAHYGKDDIFFAKYDSLGNYAFVKAVGGSYDDLCWAMTLNKNKDIIIAGSFESTNNDFDPNKDQVNLPLKGGDDAYVGIYDSLGNYKYAFSFGGVKNDIVYGLTTDNDSNIIISGLFYGKVDFDPDSSVVRQASDSDADFFLAKYNQYAKLIFTTTIHVATPGYSVVTTDSTGNIYTGGYFKKIAFFTSSDSIIARGGYDVFFAKYNKNGVYNFSTQVGGTSDDYINGLAIRSNNQVCIDGSFAGTCYFDKALNKKLTAINYNGYLSVYSSVSGNNLSANAFGEYKTFTVESAAVKLAHDDQNNTYVAGTFQGIVDFDPGIQQYILTSSQDAASIRISQYWDDIFFAKYNANGQLIFAKDIGGTAGQAPISIAVDNSHNIYLTGGFEGTIDVDPGIDSVLLYRKHNTSVYDGFFIGKYDSLGNYIFAKPLYISGSLSAIAISNNKDIYVAGSFSNGYFNSDNDTSKISVNGSYLYFAKYNKNGKFIYLKSMGQSNKAQYCYDAVINKKGNILLCGVISGTQIDFDPGINTYYVNTQSNYVHFVASYSASGNFLFETNSSSLATSSDCWATQLKLDKNDNIIVTGFLDGKLDFNTGGDSLIATAQGTFTTFLSKYNNTGKPVYVKTFSEFHGDAGTGDFRILSSAIDNNNNIYLAGNFFGKVDFDPSNDTAYITADRSIHSDNNIYLSKYDSLGNYIYAYNFIPIDTFFYRGASAADVWVDKNSEITFAVNTNGTIDFDPGADTFYYHPPFDVYPTEYQSYSFVLVKFKQTQTVKPFTIYASAFKPDIDKLNAFQLQRNVFEPGANSIIGIQTGSMSLKIKR